MIEVTVYHNHQIRQLGSLKHKGGATNKSEISDEAQEERTKKQSYTIKRKIRGYALANDFKWFTTLTIDPKQYDSLDYDSSKELLLKWCRKMRDRYENFDYLIVPELNLRLMTLLKLKHAVSIEHRAHCYYNISTEPLFSL